MTIGLFWAAACGASFLVAGLCAAILGGKVREELQLYIKWIIVLAGASAISGFLGGAISVQKKGEKDLARDVNMHQVSARGASNFNAQIQLSYKDGKLDSIALIKDTTVPESSVGK